MTDFTQGIAIAASSGMQKMAPQIAVVVRAQAQLATVMCRDACKVLRH